MTETFSAVVVEETEAEEAVFFSTSASFRYVSATVSPCAAAFALSTETCSVGVVSSTPLSTSLTPSTVRRASATASADSDSAERSFPYSLIEMSSPDIEEEKLIVLMPAIVYGCAALRGDSASSMRLWIVRLESSLFSSISA